MLGPLWRYARRSKHRLESFDVPVGKLLRGGENEIRAARYAELAGNLLRPSTPAAGGPHVALLREYERIGEGVLAPGTFERTAYYRNAEECLRLTGTYFVDDLSKFRGLAERFIHEYRKARPCRTETSEPIWVRPIRHSSCFEIIDGNHRFARAILAGRKTVPVWLYDKEPALTPLQALLLDALKTRGSRRLHQPLDYPDISEGWKLSRNCAERLSMMTDFLSSMRGFGDGARTYLDIGSRYGWFVKRFEELGFQATGVERDPISRSVGFHCYGIRPEQIRTGGIARFLDTEPKRYDVVSLLCRPHEAEFEESSLSTEGLIRRVDKITGRVLLLDTDAAPEESVSGALSKWTVPFIVAWLKRHTSFTRVIPLGKERGLVTPVFACVRD